MSRDHGIQLPMLTDGSNGVALWQSERVLRAELEAFEDRLMWPRGLSDKSAAVLARHIGAMVRQVGAGTAFELIRRPALAAAAIKAPAREGTRRARHLAVTDFAQLFSDELPWGTSEALEAALASTFPGRVVPAAHLVDRALGGSRKNVRVRVPLAWADGDRVIAAAALDAADAGAAMRDTALVALHVRSGLSPDEIRTLQWDMVLPLLEASDEVEQIRVPTSKGLQMLAIHRRALDLLFQVYALEGGPTAGAVFLTSRRPRRMISASLAAMVVASAAQAAGFPPVDRRHLRVPFGLWLIERGWDELRVRDALGYDRVRDLRAALRPLQETNAQIQTREFLVLPSEPPRVDQHTELAGFPGRTHVDSVLARL